MAWTNADGLRITFGAERAEPHNGGAISTMGAQKLIEATIADLSELADTPEVVGREDGGASYGVFVPKGAVIEKVEIFTSVAADGAGDAGVLDLGFIRTDLAATEIDYDGIAANLPQANMEAGETHVITLGATGAGALIGTALAHNGLLVASYDTAAFTAGAIKIRIFYT